MLTFACLNLSKRRLEYGDFPVIELASALRALSLLLNSPNIEFENTAALLSAKLTELPFSGISKISYGTHVNEVVVPNILYDLTILICFWINSSERLGVLLSSKPIGFIVVLIATVAFLLNFSKKAMPLSPIVL